MSQHTISRIANVLEKQFAGKIDLSDWDGLPDPEKRMAFLSRAVAALCIKTLAATDVDVAARAVTDGFDDGGICRPSAAHSGWATTKLLAIAQGAWKNYTIGRI